MDQIFTVIYKKDDQDFKKISLHCFILILNQFIINKSYFLTLNYTMKA